MFFQSRNSHTGPSFKDPKTLQSFDKTAFENCVYISKYLKGLLPSAFTNSNLNHALMIPNGQTFVTFKSLFAELKPS